MASAELAATYAALILADDGAEINSEKIVAITTAAGVELEPIWATLLAKALEGRNVKEVLHPQRKRRRRRRRRRRKSPTMTWVSVFSIDPLIYFTPSFVNKHLDRFQNSSISSGLPPRDSIHVTHPRSGLYFRRTRGSIEPAQIDLCGTHVAQTLYVSGLLFYCPR
ncbi:hypothetical protein RSAG8_07046, partial [Rhizoctonia solani AG-8 WAC10335]